MESPNLSHMIFHVTLLMLGQTLHFWHPPFCLDLSLFLTHGRYMGTAEGPCLIQPGRGDEAAFAHGREQIRSVGVRAQDSLDLVAHLLAHENLPVAAHRRRIYAALLLLSRCTMTPLSDAICIRWM